jgi:hypothetical protein
MKKGSSSSVFFVLLLLLVLLSSIVVVPAAAIASTVVEVDEDEDEEDEDPCAGGACPATQLLVVADIDEEEASILLLQSAAAGESEVLLEQQHQGQSTSALLPTESSESSSTCEIWMAPSPIKKAEEHGFGLGMFTGRLIKAGTILEDEVFGSGELLIPIYGSTTIYETHPPLREYVWDEDMMDEIAVEDPSVPTALFLPGLAALAPCTSNGFNLQLSPASLSHLHDLHDDVHRDQNPVAGAVAYKYVSYMAVRDIFPGEELTVQCSDDNFYGGNYFLSRYQKDDKINGATMCLDHLQVKPSSSSSTSTPKTGGNGGSNSSSRGKGLFLKSNASQSSFEAGTTILSTPVVPIHRKDLDIDEGEHINNKQLLLNYCYGQEQSDVLLLPLAPLVNALNHDGTNPNAKLVWHQVSNNSKNDKNGTATNDDESLLLLHRRQQYHHAELLTYSVAQVVVTHGMSLAVDIIATRTIQPGDEITIDYGNQWKSAWEQHLVRFDKFKKTAAAAAAGGDKPPYQTADQFLARQEPPHAPIRTILEQERNPYPDNIEMFCDYQELLDGRLVPVSSSSSSSTTTTDEEDEDTVVLHATWNDEKAECLRPCTILDRRPLQQSTNHDGDINDNEDYNYHHDDNDYTVQLHASDNERILPHCLLETDVILSHVPYTAIHLLDRPYTSDVFLPHAFRHEIHVDFFPSNWMRQKLRRPPGTTDTTQGDEFKRKPVYVVPTTEVEV